MRQYIGRSCKIHVRRNNIDLFYTAIMLDVTVSHITFIDKFKIMYTFNLTEVIEISSIQLEKKPQKSP